MTPRLFPTPTRLRYLTEAEAGQLPELLTVAQGELVRAGWIEPDGVLGKWRLTALGRAIKAVRVLDFGDHLVAETGDEDEPRVLGDATRQTRGWLVKVGSLFVAQPRKAEAREELRHLAAIHLADNPTVQEGHAL